jgi:hypothetical protein
MAFHSGSDLKVATLGVNPAESEKILLSDDIMKEKLQKFIEQLPGTTWIKKNKATLQKIEQAANNYFEKGHSKSVTGHPYFDNFRPQLEGLEASYETDDKFKNTALHLDLIPFATKGNWGSKELGENFKKKLLDLFQPLLWLWIRELSPHIILSSIHRNNFSYLPTNQGWQNIFRMEKPNQDRMGFKTKLTWTTLLGEKRSCLLINFESMRIPWGGLSKKEKKDLGPRCYSALSKFMRQNPPDLKVARTFKLEDQIDITAIGRC